MNFPLPMCRPAPLVQTFVQSGVLSHFERLVMSPIFILNKIGKLH